MGRRCAGHHAGCGAARKGRAMMGGKVRVFAPPLNYRPHKIGRLASRGAMLPGARPFAIPSMRVHATAPGGVSRSPGALLCCG
jgi:hypothetical protein